MAKLVPVEFNPFEASKAEASQAVDHFAKLKTLQPTEMLAHNALQGPSASPETNDLQAMFAGFDAKQVPLPDEYKPATKPVLHKPGLPVQTSPSSNVYDAVDNGQIKFVWKDDGTPFYAYHFNGKDPTGKSDARFKPGEIEFPDQIDHQTGKVQKHQGELLNEYTANSGWTHKMYNASNGNKIEFAYNAAGKPEEAEEINKGSVVAVHSPEDIVFPTLIKKAPVEAKGKTGGLPVLHGEPIGKPYVFSAALNHKVEQNYNSIADPGTVSFQWDKDGKPKSATFSPENPNILLTHFKPGEIAFPDFPAPAADPKALHQGDPVHASTAGNYSTYKVKPEKGGGQVTYYWTDDKQPWFADHYDEDGVHKEYTQPQSVPKKAGTGDIADLSWPQPPTKDIYITAKSYGTSGTVKQHSDFDQDEESKVQDDESDDDPDSSILHDYEYHHKYLDHEREAIKEYGGTEYGMINRVLRQPERWGRESEYYTKNDYRQMEERIAALDTAMSKNAIPKPVTLWRGITGNIVDTLRNLRQGEIWIDPGFLSTSTDKSVANGNFADPGSDRSILLEIRAKPGLPAVIFGPKLQAHDEKEVLLPRQTKLRVIEHQPGRLVVEPVLDEPASSTGFKVYHGSQKDFSVPEPFAFAQTGEGNLDKGFGFYTAEAEGAGKFYALGGDGTSGKHKSGNLYEFKVNADKKHFINWNAPFKDQPEVVKKYFEGTEPGAMPENFLSSHVYSKEGAQKMAEAGIPGVSYLDAHSVKKGKGTRNFVIYSAKLLNLNKKSKVQEE